MLGLHRLEGAVDVSHTGDARRRREIECHILVVKLFLHAPVFLHHEGVVGGGYKQYVENTPLHQFAESGILEI